MTLRGVVPILAMPFAPDGQVDEGALRGEVEWAIGLGIDALGLALASEMPRLSQAERSTVTRVVVDQAAGRVPLVVHAAAESSVVAIELAAQAEADGAAVLMVHAPTFEATPAGQSAFFGELVAGTDLPIVLQDVPHARLDWQLAADLERRNPRRLCMKIETPPTPPAVLAARTATAGALPIFGGAGGLAFYSELLQGAIGTMPGCVVPELFVEVWRLFEAGEHDAARRRFARLVPFLAATSTPGLLLQYYREALVLRGIFRSVHARAPTVELDAIQRRELRELLDDLELADVADG